MKKETPNHKPYHDDLKHSPLPFEVIECFDDEGEGDCPYEILISCGDIEKTRTVFSEQFHNDALFHEAHDSTEAKQALIDAKFVVRACDNHYKLLELCKKALDIIDNMEDEHNLCALRASEHRDFERVINEAENGANHGMVAKPDDTLPPCYYCGNGSIIRHTISLCKDHDKVVRKIVEGEETKVEKGNA